MLLRVQVGRITSGMNGTDSEKETTAMIQTEREVGLHLMKTLLVNIEKHSSKIKIRRDNFP